MKKLQSFRNPRYFIVSLFVVYSLSSTHVIAQESDTIWVDNFATHLADSWKSKRDSLEKIYSITEVADSSFLVAYSDKGDNFLIKKIEVNLVTNPYLNWDWRAHILPLEGDESVKEHCDVAASINVVLKASKWRPRTIKYSWSTTLEQDSITKSPYAIWPSRCDIIVMESGEEKLGEWITEKVNVLEHYKQFYNKKKIKSAKVEAFVIMTDSNNTGSISAADYDNIFFSSQ